MLTNVKGLRAVVTGGGSGIGLAITRRLTELGCNVTICGRNKEKLESAAAEIGKAPGEENVGTYALDVKDEGAVEAFAGWLGSHGGVDILVNSAGVVVNAPLEQTRLEDFANILETNVLGAFLACKHLLPLLRRSEAASIVNLCSAASHSQERGQGAYSASKAALLSLTKTLALEAYQEGIRVHAICPGAVATDMIGKARPELSDVRMIEADDIADVVEYFLTHRTNAVVDEVIVHRVDRQPWPYGG